MSEHVDCELIYLVREVRFGGGPRYLAYHSEDIGRSREESDALLPLANLLFLRHPGIPSPKYFTAAEDGKKCISTTNIVCFVHDKLKGLLNAKVRSNVISKEDKDDFLKNSKDTIRQLSYKLDLYPIIKSLTSFKGKAQSFHLKLFELLDVVVYTGLLPDRNKDKDTYQVVHGEFYCDLLLLARTLVPNRPAKMELITKFIFNSLGLTPYGFDCLQKHVPEQSLSIMWRNMATFVLFKREGIIYILLPEEMYPGVMWVAMEDADGNGRIAGSDFSPIKLPFEEMADELIEEDEKAKKEKEMKEKAKKEKGKGKMFKDLKGEQPSQIDMSSTQKFVETDVSTLEVCQNPGLRAVPELCSVYTFKQFAAENVMYTVYKFGTQDFESTSYVGRRMAKGYLDFILKMHKRILSWNGSFTEEDMCVTIIRGELHFEIKLPAQYSFIIDYGVADFKKYHEIMTPHYKSHSDAEVSWYFDKLLSDFRFLPSPVLSSQEFNKFQKYLGNHMCWKSPLVRSSFISNLYRVCKSLVLDGGSIYRPLYFVDRRYNWGRSINNFCMPFEKVYFHECINREGSRYNHHTFWCALWLARNVLEHLLDYTKVDGVQQITDVVIADLILEHNLRGYLSDLVRTVMRQNNFDDEFASIWRHFEASESFDDLNSPPSSYCCTDP